MRIGSGSLLLGGLAGSPLLLWLALPGRFSFWPVLTVCLVPLFFWLADSTNSKQAALRGFFAGVVLHVFQLYWIISVLMTYGGISWYIAVPALLLLASYMGVYLALFSGCFYRFMAARRHTYLLLGAPAVWVGLDWFRSWFFGGFPWMDIGYGFWSVPQILQAADLFGHYGYTFLAVLLNISLFSLVSSRFNWQRKRAAMTVALLLIGTVGVYSSYRWSEVRDDMNSAQYRLVGMVQGNVAQGKKWSSEEREKTVRRYIELSERVTKNQDVSLVVWPETAIPFYPRSNEMFRPVRSFVTGTGTAVLTGAPWYEIIDWDKKQIEYYNSAVLVGTDGGFDGLYHKSHLVPYGEYIPLKKYMPFLAPLVESVGDFTRGHIENPLKINQIRLGVLICYESIFGSISRKWVQEGANLLVNLTNDAWYGKSSAPYQSWAMTIFRSVETRRSLVRSANTGISGIIDPLGRGTLKSDLFIPWSGLARVPLMTGKTYFVRAGWLFAPICAIAGLVSCITISRSRRYGRL